MLKIIPFDTPTPKETTLRLRLKAEGTEVFLRAVDENGKDIESGHLLRIREDANGKAVFVACRYVDKNIPVLVNGIDNKLVVL